MLISESSKVTIDENHEELNIMYFGVCRAGLDKVTPRKQKYIREKNSTFDHKEVETEK